MQNFNFEYEFFFKSYTFVFSLRVRVYSVAKDPNITYFIEPSVKSRLYSARSRYFYVIFTFVLSKAFGRLAIC